MFTVFLVLLGIMTSVLFAELGPGLSKSDGWAIACLIGIGYVTCVLVSSANLIAICVYICLVAIGTVWKTDEVKKSR